jgi:hypothetical protein
MTLGNSIIVFIFEDRRSRFCCVSVFRAPETVIGSIGPIATYQRAEADSKTDRQNFERQTISPT